MSKQHYAMRWYLLIAVAASVMTQLLVQQLWPAALRLNWTGIFFGVALALVSAAIFWYHAVYRVLMAPNSALPERSLVQRLHSGYMGKVLRWIAYQRLL